MTTTFQPGVRRRIQRAVARVRGARTMAYDLEITPAMPADAQLVCEEALTHLRKAEAALRSLLARAATTTEKDRCTSPTCS